MEMARCLLYEKCFLKEYCAEATHTLVFLLNILPAKTLEGKTPFEVLYGYKRFFEKSQSVWMFVLYLCATDIKR